MDNFKQGTRVGLRFVTTKGSLSIENLWTLSITDLDSLAVRLDEEYKESGKKSFIVKKTKKDKDLKLRLDIVVEILTTKVEEMEAAKDLASNKEHNEGILRLIKNKQDEKLASMSEEELKKLLK